MEEKSGLEAYHNYVVNTSFFSHITESQLQQYLSAKYEQFLKQQETGQFPWPCIKLAAKEVGLQEFERKILQRLVLQNMHLECGH